MNNAQTQPQIIIASESLDFRRLAREKITPEDFFLEIGCSFGECTRLLAEMGCSGLALISPIYWPIGRARTLRFPINCSTCHAAQSFTTDYSP